jgi:crossover junction endodeoxyribonuclease RusA
LEISFPVEFIVDGTPVSSGAKRPETKKEWKDRVKAASRTALPEGHWACGGRIAGTLFYFPDERVQGDVDNIVKLVLDALCRHVYIDDAQVERVLVQKFEPGNVFPFSSPSGGLEQALRSRKPVLYVHLSDDPFEDLI